MDTLQRILAIEEIKQLKARYFRLIDTKDWGGLESIFTEHAVFDLREALGSSLGGDDLLLQGRDQIIRFIVDRISDSKTVHHGHMCEIEILSEDTARGIIPMEDLSRVEKDGVLVRSLHGYGHYHDTYRRQDGRWRVETSKLTRLRLEVA